jgi:WD40 repeat protein
MFITAVAVTCDGRKIISASYDQTVKVWDLESGECIATFTVDAPVRACAVARDGVTIVVGDSAGTVHFLTLVVPGD